MVESIKELREICEKDTKGKDRPISEVMPRFLAIYITWVLLHTGITANQVTLLGFLIAVAGGIMFILGGKWLIVIGALLLIVNFLLDYVDGEVARYRGKASMTGAYISRLLGHHILESYIFATLPFGVYSALHDVKVFAFGLVAAISVLLIRLTVFNSYAGVVEAGLSLRRGSGLKKYLSPENSVESGDNGLSTPVEHVSSFITSRSPFLYTLFENLLSPGKELMLLTAGILDVVLNPVTVGRFTFDFVYLYLILWAILTMLAWITLATITIKRRTPETLFNQLFGEDNEH
jgi:phosphatidylglycerophosphate synthase